MKKTSKKTEAFLLAAFAFVFAASVAKAQVIPLDLPDPDSKEFDVSQEPPSGSMTQIASVGAYAARIVSYENQKMAVQFDLVNDMGTQAEVKYGVTLLREGGHVVDSYVAPETLTLYEKQTVRKNFSYEIKNVPDGKYYVYLEVKNSDSLLLAGASLGIVEVKSVAPVASIDQSSCYLTIFGEKNSKKYRLNQGVDVSGAEQLAVHCVIANASGDDLAVVPHVAINFRTSFGKSIQESDLAGAVIKKGSAEYVFDLPKLDKPQAYDAMLVLHDQGGNAVSNKVLAHYVVNGAAVAVQNITTDKDRYAKGDNAEVSFSWGGVIGSFPGARGASFPLDEADVIISITASTGECGQAVSKKMKNGRDLLMTFAIPIVAECVDPSVSVKVQDPAGIVLADESYVIRSNPASAAAMLPPSVARPAYFGIGYAILVISVIMLIAVGAVYWIRKRKIAHPASDPAVKKSRGKIALLFLFVFAGVLLSGQKSQATTFSDLTTNGIATYTVQLDQQVYPQRGKITVSAWVTATASSSEWNFVTLNGKINGQTKSILFGAIPGTIGYGPFIQLFRAPSEAGGYTAGFWSITNKGTGWESYSVAAGTAPVVSATCGRLATANAELSRDQINQYLAAVDTTIDNITTPNEDYNKAVTQCYNCLAAIRSQWNYGLPLGPDDTFCLGNPWPLFKDNNKAYINFNQNSGYWATRTFWGQTGTVVILGMSIPKMGWVTESYWVPTWNFDKTATCQKNCGGTPFPGGIALCDIVTAGDPKASDFCGSGISPKLAAEVTRSGLNWEWTCKGLDGINVSCSAPAVSVNTCGIEPKTCTNGGTFVESSYKTNADRSITLWSCKLDDNQGGQISDCKNEKGVKGGCGPAAGNSITYPSNAPPTTNLCAGLFQLSGSVTSTENTFDWKCANSATTVDCLAPRASCTGVLPQNASKCPNNPQFVASWTYDANCSGSGECRFNCSGTTSNWNGSFCQAAPVYSCPGQPTGSTICQGSNPILLRPVASWTYDANCSGSAKCRYFCPSPLVPNSSNTACEKRAGWQEVNP